jgi:hypothetical protein
MRPRTDADAVRFALSKTNDGFLFEQFAQAFLAAVVGYEFVPVGGLHDRGIDGLEYSSRRKDNASFVYQMSIEADPPKKLKKSLSALDKNDVEYGVFTFVTNRNFPDKDLAIDTAHEDHPGKSFRIYDAAWFASNIAANDAARRVYGEFVDRNLHEYNEPGRTIEFVEQVRDPRLYVFLRQQVDRQPSSQSLNKTVADALIIFALRGTDPNTGILRSRDEILSRIEEALGFRPQLLTAAIDRRLERLRMKQGRQINYHSRDDAYCLPFKTREQIRDANLHDEQLRTDFMEQTEATLQRHLSNEGVSVGDGPILVERTISKIFYQQGLEFADFILDKDQAASGVLEKSLSEIVSQVVSETASISSNRGKVERALQHTIRDIIYRGSEEQCEYVQRLSRTYMMLFLLRCDPKVASFFGTMASRLRLYVCTSILIPALSEHFLAAPQRRHAALLKGAHRKGVELIVTDSILDELVAHFRRIIRRYEEEFRHLEDVFTDDVQSLYVDEILIRAYFYAKQHGEVRTFAEFINNFVTYNLEHAREELSDLLSEEFGIRYSSDSPESIGVDPDEHQKLYEAVKKCKSDDEKAKNDADVILMVVTDRQRRNELGTSGPFGYATWWFSKDQRTQKALRTALGDKYPARCYMRPEFLNVYISLAPSAAEVSSAYERVFPSLVGVNISAQLPHDVIESVQQKLLEHRELRPARLRAVLRTLADELKVGRFTKADDALKHFLDEQLEAVDRGR